MSRLVTFSAHNMFKNSGSSTTDKWSKIKKFCLSFSVHPLHLTCSFIFTDTNLLQTPCYYSRIYIYRQHLLWPCSHSPLSPQDGLGHLAPTFWVLTNKVMHCAFVLMKIFITIFNTFLDSDSTLYSTVSPRAFQQ